jgi:hypothetical protein
MGVNGFGRSNRTKGQNGHFGKVRFVQTRPRAGYIIKMYPQRRWSGPDKKIFSIGVRLFVRSPYGIPP